MHCGIDNTLWSNGSRQQSGQVCLLVTDVVIVIIELQSMSRI